MREALAEARIDASLGEVPIGAVVVWDGEIVARAHNTRETDKNALGHAECSAIAEACKTPVFSRCHAFVFSEYFNKIAAVIEAAFHTDIRNGQSGAVKHPGCLFNSIHIYIFNGSLVRNGTEKAAEVSGVHAYNIGQVI